MSPSGTDLEKGSGSGNSFCTKYCRMCALELKQGVFIFGEEGKRLQIPEKIRKTLSILVLEEDSLPKKICTDCCSSLEDYSQYKDTVLDAQEKLTAIARNLERSQEHNLQQTQLKLQNKTKSRKPLATQQASSPPAGLQPILYDDVPSGPEDSVDEPMTFDEPIDDHTAESPEPDPPQIERGVEETLKKSTSLVETPSESQLQSNENGENPTASSSSSRRVQHGQQDGQDAQQESVENEEKSILCGICGDVMADRTALEVHHKKSHVGEKHSLPVYGCPFCNRVSENFNAIRIHIYRHRKEGDFKCVECDNVKLFPSKDQLDRHILSAHNNGLKAFSCKVCGKRFSAKCSLVVHMTSKHSCSKTVEISESINSRDEEDDPPVLVLETKTSPEKLQKPSSLSLENAEKNTKVSKPLNDKKQGDNKKAGKNSDAGVWRCEYCDKIHQTLAGHQSHIATHKGKRFACDLCNAVFTQKGALSHHVTAKHGQAMKEFICPVCNKEFRTSKHLKMHIQFHNTEPDSKETCPVCQKVYKTKAHLKSHLKTHKSQKNFPCPTCAKSFATQQKLNDHKNSHSGARPYKCDHCEYTASHVGQFYRHKNTHGKDLQQSESKSTTTTSNERIQQESQSHGNSSTSPVLVSTDLSTKSPQKSQQTHSSLSNANNQQSSSFISQQSSAIQSQAMGASSGHNVTEVQVLHTSSQTYSHSSQQLWSSNNNNNNNGQIQGGGRTYQSSSASSSSAAGGMSSIDLVDCAIQHTLTSEDLSSHSHSTSHIHNYSPNNHSNHNGNNGPSVPNQFVSTSAPVTSNGNNTSIVSVASLSSQPHQSEPMELSYKLQIESSEFQDMPMELTKVFQRDPLELCVRQDFNPLMDLSSRVGNVTDPNGMSMNSMSMNMNNMSSNGMSSGMNGMGMGYHKLDITERELSFNDLSGAFRQPIDLIARTDENAHELCSEGNLVDLSLRSSFVQDQSASSFLRELIDLSARSDSFHGELNLTNKHHHQTSHPHMHQSNNNNNNHHGNNSMNKHTNGNHHHHHNGNGTGTLQIQNVIYQDAMFSLQN